MNPPFALSSNIPTQPINNTNDEFELSFSLCHEQDYSYWHLYLC